AQPKRLFETESLQQPVDSRQVHHHLARFRTLVSADHAMLGELVDDAARARVADVELALNQRHRRATFSRDRSSRACKQRVELALRALASTRPLRTRALLEDLLHVSRRSLRFPEADDRFDLGVADERALDARRLARIYRLVQHVAAPQQLLRAARVEDDAAVDLRPNRECDARGEVGLDEAGDDVSRRALRGDDEMDANGSRQLRDAAYQLFDLAGRDHHQVSELVDHDHDI